MGNSNLRNCINGQQLPPIFLSLKTEIIAEIYTDKDNLHTQIRILTLYIQCIFSYFFYAELSSYLWGNKKYTYFSFFFFFKSQKLINNTKKSSPLFWTPQRILKTLHFHLLKALVTYPFPAVLTYSPEHIYGRTKYLNPLKPECTWNEIIMCTPKENIFERSCIIKILLTQTNTSINIFLKQQKAIEE